MAKTIEELIIEYFKEYAGEALRHGPVVDWVSKEYLKDHDTPPRDPWRAIRRLYQQGHLIKVAKGLYKYDPAAGHTQITGFTPEQRQEIFERDGYRCVVCGRGRREGVEICADHILPVDRGGASTVDNGQTLCQEHNLLKKNYSATEAGKRYFISLYGQALDHHDERMIKFCRHVFDVYDEHGIDRHIPRPNGR